MKVIHSCVRTGTVLSLALLWHGLTSWALSESVPATGLVASYRFCGNADDTSGNNNHGQVHGATLTFDRCNVPMAAYNFASRDELINLPATVLSSEAGTIALWIKTSQPVTGATGAGSYVPFFAREEFDDIGAARLLVIGLGDSTFLIEQEMLLVATSTGLDHGRSAVSTAQLPEISSEWHHLAVTSSAAGHTFYFDGAELPPTLFLDGISPASNFWPLDAVEVRLGGDPSSDEIDKPFALDDVFLYDRALTALEIEQLFLADCHCPPLDADGDGDPDTSDCAPEDPTVHHGAVELCNGIDDNCNGEVDEVDTDGDAVPDCDDACPQSNVHPTLLIGDCDSDVPNLSAAQGCTLADLISGCAASAANHGEFVACVSHLTNQLQALGLITGRQKGAIQKCAAQADIP